MAHVSRLSSKGQVTIPADIRRALELSAGDVVAYELKGDRAIIKKLRPFDAAYHAAVGETLEEWSSPEDEAAFNDL
jgi:AbrB family looped-hinge helix DNA binding protein